MGAKTKTEKRPLMCRLSEQELEEQGKALTDLLQEKAELEISKSASARHYSDAIKAVDVKIEKQIPIVRDREIEREVECRIEYHTPEPGKKREVRLDTLEVIFEGQMTDAECQDLFINTEPAEEDAAEDDAIDVPAVKLLPAAADDTEPIIHVEKPETGTVCQVNLNEGKLYEVEGVVCRCVRETEDGLCDGCMLLDKEDLCYEYSFACDGVILKAGIVRPSNAEPNEAEATATPEDKPSEEERRPVETMNPIHVGKLDVEDLPEVRFEVGKEYEIGGKIFRCEHETEGKCFGCDIADTVCLDYSFECDGVVLKEVGCEAQKDEPDTAETHKCEDCGKVPAAGFVWLPNKWLCKACNDKRNKSKLANLPPDDDLQGLKIRAYHYKGVTNFKFILHGKASWGNPINLFGDYSDPNTESEALNFYHHLKSKGCIEA